MCNRAVSSCPHAWGVCYKERYGDGTHLGGFTALGKAGSWQRATRRHPTSCLGETASPDSGPTGLVLKGPCLLRDHRPLSERSQVFLFSWDVGQGRLEVVGRAETEAETGWKQNGGWSLLWRMEFGGQLPGGHSKSQQSQRGLPHFLYSFSCFLLWENSSKYKSERMGTILT